jgi:hypothetical protein
MSAESPALEPEAQLFANVRTEVLRVEEDCIHSSKSHFNAAERWSTYNFFLGVPSIVLSVLAGTAFLRDYPGLAGLMSGIAAVLTALITFLKPAERAAAHKAAGDQYLTLRNECRVFREIKLSHNRNMTAAIMSMAELTARRNDLNQTSPQFSDQDRRLARKGIEEGEATHIVDKVRN